MSDKILKFNFPKEDGDERKRRFEPFYREMQWILKFLVEGDISVGVHVQRGTPNGSFYGFLASMDLKEKPVFFAAANVSRNDEELSNNIAVYTANALREFKEQYGALPRRIFFFRDDIRKEEGGRNVEALTEILNRFGNRFGTAKPKLAFIIVNGPNDDDGLYNFFLVSQYLRYGTVAPTSYRSTDRKCNWSLPKRFPTVLNYANKLATAFARAWGSEQQLVLL